MRRFLVLFTFSALLILMGISTTSCNRGYGCPAVDTQVKTNRKGKLPSKGGSSTLFPKKMRKN